jgi:hypothetical protein
VEENTFIEEEGVKKGALHYFVGKDGIERLFENFEIISLELSDKEVEGKLESRDNHSNCKITYLPFSWEELDL